jgi:hypothetical protein
MKRRTNRYFEHQEYVGWQNVRETTDQSKPFPIFQPEGFLNHWWLSYFG